MQIKFILATVGTVACLSGAIFSMQAIAENTKFSSTHSSTHRGQVLQYSIYFPFTARLTVA